MPIWSKGENTASKGLLGHTAVLNALVVAGKEVPSGEDVKLRLLKTKNNQEKGVRWAKDYEL